MRRNGETESDLEIAAAAAEWVARKDRGLTPAEAAEFEDWRSADSRRAATFARTCEEWRGLDSLSAISALSNEADILIDRARLRRRRQKTIRLNFLTLATAAIVAVGFLRRSDVTTPQPEPMAFRVVAKTSREIILPDGSVVTLNGASRITTTFTPHERRVQLLDGEASFDVAKDPKREFCVVAGTVIVKAIGTAFNVRLGSEAVQVLVTEGKVGVNDQLSGASLLPAAHARDLSAKSGVGALEAGHQLVIKCGLADEKNAVQLSAVTPSEIEHATAWQAARLVFDETPLDQVVAAFNRYSEHKLMLGEPTLRARKITGVFRADNSEGFARLLATGPDVVAVRKTDALSVLLTRP